MLEWRWPGCSWRLDALVGSLRRDRRPCARAKQNKGGKGEEQTLRAIVASSRWVGVGVGLSVRDFKDHW